MSSKTWVGLLQGLGNPLLTTPTSSRILHSSGKLQDSNIVLVETQTLARKKQKRKVSIQQSELQPGSASLP